MNRNCFQQDRRRDVLLFPPRLPSCNQCSAGFLFGRSFQKLFVLLVICGLKWRLNERCPPPAAPIFQVIPSASERPVTHSGTEGRGQVALTINTNATRQTHKHNPKATRDKANTQTQTSHSLGDWGRGQVAPSINTNATRLKQSKHTITIQSLKQEWLNCVKHKHQRKTRKSNSKGKHNQTPNM